MDVSNNFCQRLGIAEGWGIEFRQARQPKPNEELMYKFYSTVQLRSVKLDIQHNSEQKVDAALGHPP
jgi:hypothetical protein